MRILFVDTETSGYLEDFNISVSDYWKIPEIAEIAWIIDDENGKTKKKKFNMINGFSTKNDYQANIPYSDIETVLKELQKDLKKTDLIVSHNYKFDYKIISAAFIRHDFENLLDGINSYCTMEESLEFCEIRNENGKLKFPTLTQLHYKLTGLPLKTPHEAYLDTTFLRNCFWRLFRNGQVNLDLRKQHHKIWDAISLIIIPFIYQLRIGKGNEFLEHIQSELFKINPENAYSILNILREFEKKPKDIAKLVSIITKYSSRFSKDLNIYLTSIAITSTSYKKNFCDVIDVENKEYASYLKENNIIDIESFNNTFDSKYSSSVKFEKYTEDVYKAVKLNKLKIEDINVIDKYLTNKEFTFRTIEIHNQIVTDNNKEGCFIATLCYENELSAEVIDFKFFRDNVLSKYKLGIIFIKNYYIYSPKIVHYLREKVIIVSLIKNLILNPLLFLIRFFKP